MNSKKLGSSSIHVKDVNLWAHVGFLDEERLLGQDFLLDFSICMDLSQAAQTDDFSFSADYRIGIKAVQQLAFKINCLTIEQFSEQILDLLEKLYGLVPMKILLRKCSPPIDGFDGTVSVERTRHYELLEISS